MGRTLGIILLAGGVVACLILALVMYVPTMEGSRSAGAATLGFGLGAAVVVLPLVGVGAFMLWRGGQEAKAMAAVQQQRKLLDMVKTRGQMAISDLALELNTGREAVQHIIYDLVGKGLFSGYVNWQEGVLYSRQASQMREQTKCQHCGGQLELAGKGVIRCPFCGTEYFLD